MRRIFHWIFSQIAPIRCLGCFEIGVELCDVCHEQIYPDLSYEYLRGIKIWTAMSYHFGIHNSLIEYWKYYGMMQNRDYFFTHLSLPDFTKIDLFIPVPLHRRRLVERGFNQSQQIADALNSHFGCKVSSDLKRVRFTKAQAQLNKLERKKNVQSAFQWKGDDLSKDNICLIDDVYSTGSTIGACIDALRKGGANNIEVFCLLRSEPKEKSFNHEALFWRRGRDSNPRPEYKPE